MIRMKVKSVLEEKALRVMFQDESRFGRIDNPKRCWAQKGIRPETHKQIIREYTYLYGAFSPQDGRMDSYILPYMNMECMNIFLKEVGTRYPDEIILMVMDGAPCHNEGITLEVPRNMYLLKLPPYAPQLNPAENMWDEIKEKFFGNLSFESMSDLEKHLLSAALFYEQASDTVSSICNWDWMNLNFV